MPWPSGFVQKSLRPMDMDSRGCHEARCKETPRVQHVPKRSRRESGACAL